MPWLRGLLETLCSRHASGVTGSSADSGADGGSALPASPLGHLQRDNARARRAAERERDGFLRYYSALTGALYSPYLYTYPQPSPTAPPDLSCPLLPQHPSNTHQPGTCWC